MSLMTSVVFDLIDQKIDDSFGFGSYPEQEFLPVMRRKPSIYNARWQPFLRSAQHHRDKQDKLLYNSSCINKDGYQHVSLDIEHFALNKTTGNTILKIPLLRE